MPGKGKPSTERWTKPGRRHFLADVAETRGGWIFLGIPGGGCLLPDSLSHSSLSEQGPTCEADGICASQAESGSPSPGQGALFFDCGLRWLASGFPPRSCSSSTGSRALLASQALNHCHPAKASCNTGGSLCVTRPLRVTWRRWHFCAVPALCAAWVWSPCCSGPGRTCSAHYNHHASPHRPPDWLLCQPDTSQSHQRGRSLG